MKHAFLLLVLLVTAAARAAAADIELLYVAQVGGNIEILKHVPDDGPVNLTSNAAADSFPAWSPDGRRIAFCSNRDAGVFNVFVMNADGSEVERISDAKRGDKMNYFCPSWSPDGESLAYQRREGDRSDLYTMELESGRVRHLTENAWDPAWSPSGDKIVFTGLGEKGWDLFTIEPDGAKRTQIHANEGKVGYVYPGWSPDGKRIVFTTPAGDSYELAVCDSDGNNLTALTKVGRMNTHAVWDVSGSQIHYLHDLDGKQWRWDTVDVETGKTAALASVPVASYVHGGRIAVRRK